MRKRLGRNLALLLHPVHVHPEPQALAQGVRVCREAREADVEFVRDGKDLGGGGRALVLGKERGSGVERGAVGGEE